MFYSYLFNILILRLFFKNTMKTFLNITYNDYLCVFGDKRTRFNYLLDKFVLIVEKLLSTKNCFNEVNPIKKFNFGRIPFLLCFVCVAQKFKTNKLFPMTLNNLFLISILYFVIR